MKAKAQSMGAPKAQGLPSKNAGYLKGKADSSMLKTGFKKQSQPKVEQTGKKK